MQKDLLGNVSSDADTDKYQQWAFDLKNCIEEYYMGNLEAIRRETNEDLDEK